MFHKKHFSLSQAQQLLPELKLKLARIIELKQSLDKQGYDIYKHQFFGGIGTNGSSNLPEDLKELIRLVNIILEDGIIIKGISEGLIDFPHIRSNGEEVYLCFLFGEEKIKFWHRVADGFAGRRKLEEL